MSTLQVLRKRLKSIQATADMASAMKTASSVKFAKISREFGNIEAYTRACENTLALFGDAALPRTTETVSERNCLVLFSNDRGFSGGFNSEILKFFEQCLENESVTPHLRVYGQKGIHFCRTKNLEFEAYPLNDIPSYADAEELTGRLFDLYASGEVNQVKIIYQHFDNMMTQKPTVEVLLPHPVKETVMSHGKILFLPDRKTAMEKPSMYCLTNAVYGIMLGHCAGIQAATTIAMRSACDNAEESIEHLETLINRIRQAEVTNSVIETSSFLAGQS